MKSTLVVLSLLAVASGMAGCQLVGMSDTTQGLMETQAGDSVFVHRDVWGRDYYYDKGSKVYVNQTSGVGTANRPTHWNP